MVLAELTGCIAERLEQVSNSRIFRLKSDCRSWHSDFGQAGAEWVLAADEGCTAGGTTLLAVVVGEGTALFGNPINVGGVITHHAVAEMTNIPRANIIAPQDKDIRLLTRTTRWFGHNVLLCHPMTGWSLPRILLMYG